MSDHMNSDEQIQSLYNQTKNLRSPNNLDDLVLGKIRTLEAQPEPVTSDKLWLYLPIAASILLVVLLQLRGNEKASDEIQALDIAKLPAPKNTPLKLNDRQKNQLPQLYFLPTEDIKNKVVRACTGGLVTPEDRIQTLNKQQKPAKKNKPSNIPIPQMYPNDANQNNPKCDNVSNQIFKKH